MSDWDKAKNEIDRLHAKADGIERRMDAARADDTTKMTKNIYNGDRYVKLELIETGTKPDVKYKVAIGSRVFGSDLSFRDAQAKFNEVDKSESKPVPKKKVEGGGGYRSEMSVFFPKVRR